MSVVFCSGAEEPVRRIDLSAHYHHRCGLNFSFVVFCSDWPDGEENFERPIGNVPREGVEGWGVSAAQIQDLRHSAEVAARESKQPLSTRHLTVCSANDRDLSPLPGEQRERCRELER